MGFIIPVFAESNIFIDQNRPIGRDTVIQVVTFEDGYIHKKVISNVTVSVNGETYRGETNRYGFIAFPINLSASKFSPGEYEVLIEIANKTYTDILRVSNGNFK